MSSQPSGPEQDTDQGLCVDNSLRTGSQHFEMLDARVPSPAGRHCTAEDWSHDCWRRCRDMDARRDGWHRV
jgi:hypothetical protein